VGDVRTMYVPEAHDGVTPLPLWLQFHGYGMSSAGEVSMLRTDAEENGYVTVPTRPGLGIDLDWDRLAGHPYERANMLPLFVPGWERRKDDELT